MSHGPTFIVAVPTLNAARHWHALQDGLAQQSLQPQAVLILDSSSDDATPQLAVAAGYDLLVIERSDFNHGLTRQIAIDSRSDVEVVVFLTQDAVLASPDSLAALIAPFADPAVGATYGRQLSQPNATAVEAHARLFNYPPTGQVKTWDDRHRLGIKATFLSNSFAAYRRTAQQAVGGFPLTIMAEDALVAGRMLMAGWKIVYVAEATALHSHPYSVAEEFHRHFDIGVYHAREAWLLENFGGAGGEGLRYVRSELNYVLRHSPLLLPGALARTFAKYLGYKLGRSEARLSPAMRRRLSMHKRFWDTDSPPQTAAE